MSETSPLVSVIEAAEQLGVSSLRLRQMIRDGQVETLRDNQGRLRVRLPKNPTKLQFAAAASPGDTSETTKTELLIEELAELRAELSERERGIARLLNLAARQQSVLERALDLAELRGPPAPARMHEIADQRDRAMALAERAIERLDQRNTALQRLRTLFDRALSLFDRQSGVRS